MIYKKMIEVMRGVTSIEKNRKNIKQGFSFRSIDDTLNALHGLFADAGIFILTDAIGEATVTERTSSSGSVLIYTQAKWKFTFCAEDGSFVSSTTIGEAMDTGDKGTNKSMSIALKYALLQTFLIPTQEEKDPDAQSYTIQGLDFEQIDIAQKMIDSMGLNTRLVLNKLNLKKLCDCPPHKFNDLLNAIKKMEVL